MKKYLIKDRDEITIGRFSKKEDRDKALSRFVSHGFASDTGKCDGCGIDLILKNIVNHEGGYFSCRGCGA